MANTRYEKERATGLQLAPDGKSKFLSRGKYGGEDQQTGSGPYGRPQTQTGTRNQSSQTKQGKAGSSGRGSNRHAYGDEEQKVGFLTMLQEHLALPFSVSILGVEAVVEKVDMTRDGRIVAICRREGIRQRVEILDLPLPKPTPAGSEWIAAYSYWSRGF
jgi:hypothetical protein